MFDKTLGGIVPEQIIDMEKLIQVLGGPF